MPIIPLSIGGCFILNFTKEASDPASVAKPKSC